MSHRRRLVGVNYAAPGTYLVTVVTHQRLGLLGSLGAHGVRSSPIGQCVTEAWQHIPLHRPWISTGAFVIMPDHWHGMLWWHTVPPDRHGHLSIIVNGVKAEATRLARERGVLRCDEKLWMRSYDVRFLNSNKAIEHGERYVLDNPRRAWLRLGG